MVTDERTPVVSLVWLDRLGWSEPGRALTPGRLAELRQQGAREVIECDFGGWLSDEARAALGPPWHQGEHCRAYRW